MNKLINSSLKIEIDDLSGLEIVDLLHEHLAQMRKISPPESVHALDLDRLRKPDITFWCARNENELLGCAALKRLTEKCAEVKSMRVRASHQRKGVGGKLLEHLVEVAKNSAYKELYLETGSMAFFSPARSLYERFGFHYCGPFADYKDDPNSVFMKKTL